ncbi:MAG: hypothetical protein JOZ97_07225, partial [Candidatus Eremiobacteraeota bacterium]|nr:hypothetical protein [Candidatus Eremiobacteraeota bacterium]
AIEEKIGNLVFTDRPLQENASVADSFLRLAALNGDQSYREKAATILRAYARSYGVAGTFAASYARAVRRYLTPEPTITIVASEPEATPFRAAALRVNEPLVSIAAIDPSNEAALRERGYEKMQRPAAYFCRGNTCAPPVFEPAELPSVVAEFKRLQMTAPAQ